jgi:ABC-type multidrug transport system fused ATPase/permease subunit
LALLILKQRWLAIRLDFFGSLLAFSVTLLSVWTRYTISPSQTGVLLTFFPFIQVVSVTFILDITSFLPQAFTWMAQQSAAVETDMTSVERIVYYSKEIEQERPFEIPANKPPPCWPAEGRIELSNVVLKYRPELPIVLKGISLSIGAGEKIGIVGR